MKKYIFLSFILIFTGVTVFAQDTGDKAAFREYQPGYFQNFILKGISTFEQKSETPTVHRSLKMDFDGMKVPNDIDLYKKQWYNTPVSQGNTGSCWCFATTSFFESEIFRMTGKKVKLSEMFTVYWEYVEKAKYFVETRGESAFEQGSEANAVNRIWKTYGISPDTSYNGLSEGQVYHNHEKMYDEMNNYLKGVKKANAWNTDEVESTIRSILDHYMGRVPEMLTIDGKQVTPQYYLKFILKLNMDNYVDVMSLMQYPYFTYAEYPVEDNWWHSTEYLNVPLTDYMVILKKAIQKGYTLCIGGDVSEAGFDPSLQVAVVPSFDIPTTSINEAARQFRFSNKTTTDDHGVHLVGIYEKDGETWYLIKDSGSGSRNCGKEHKNFGFYFFREDYIKLKIMDFMVHKDMLKDIMGKVK
ncbi:MAG: peptidase C1 [Bacteroidetes bacterium]|nr:peptidase C1 [Bacteroidota bacterium]MBU1719876.1 peptidase C1 [Bacteroidota bacterium]